ncbi:MAG TPA: hypothetical protein VGH58_00255 [Solirubrobacterales bacterium]|jgi:hypothetical protein
MRRPSFATFQPEARPATVTGMQGGGAAAVDELEIGKLRLHDRVPPGAEPGGAVD